MNGAIPMDTSLLIDWSREAIRLTLMLGGPILGIALVYWQVLRKLLYDWANDGNSIMRAPLNSAFIPETIVTGQSVPVALAVDATHIYWSNFGNNTIWRANLVGGTNPQQLISGQNNPVAIAVGS
jgi:hypothetical protein